MDQTLATLLVLTCTLTNLINKTLQAMPATSTRMVVKLVHRDSIHSPYFNKNDNQTDRIKRTLESSVARFTYMQKVIKASADDDFQADILAMGSTFLANISIGNPPVPQFLIMDTGSSLLWIYCLPCEGRSNQKGPMFNPTKSLTYANVSCFSRYCGEYAPGGRCNLLNQCEYNQFYSRGTRSTGIFSKDTLTLKTSDEGSVSISGLLFGCSHKTRTSYEGRSGVLGLGFGKISLVAQLGDKFSYCIGSVLDYGYRHNKLILGNEAEFEGDSTPLEVIDGKYYVTLEGISIGERRLVIDSNIFKRNTLTASGVIFDSGAPATWLAEEGYKALKNEIQSLLSMCTKTFPIDDLLQVCYTGKIKDVGGFPTVTFHFANGAELVLDEYSLFGQVDATTFCMFVFPNSEANAGNLSLIGLFAQQNYNIGYDIFGKKMTFQRIDCALLN